MTKSTKKIMLDTNRSNLIKHLLCVAGICLISGCSSISDGIGEKIQDQLTEYLDHQTKRDAEVQRVLGLESDMQIIVNEIGKLSNIGTDPLGNSDGVAIGKVGKTNSNKKKPTRKSGCRNANTLTLGHCYK